MTKSEVLRIIAQALEDGAPTPINITTFPARMGVLVRDSSEMTVWADVFDLSPVDCAYNGEYMPEGETMVRLSNDDIEIEYIAKADAR